MQAAEPHWPFCWLQCHWRDTEFESVLLFRWYPGKLLLVQQLKDQI